LEEISNADIDMLPSFEERNNFVFIGNFLHETIGMQFNKRNYLASYKKQFPQAVLNVYGAYPSQKVLQLNIKEGFIVRAAPLMRVLWCKSNVSSIAFWCRN
jgi:hypothetical protein